MSRVILKRYFYPVGQGLCCREEFLLENGEKFNLVYDCGSGISESPDDDVVNQISSYFAGCDIDVLFFSHFHNDHTNLLKTLVESGIKIRKIILPLIDLAEYNILKEIDGHCNDALLKVALEGDRIFGIDVHRLLGRSELLSDSDIFNKISRFWNYETFNYQFITKSKEFLSKLKPNINPKKLFSANFVLANKAKLKEIYESIGSVNEQSTVLFSYPKKDYVVNFDSFSRKITGDIGKECFNNMYYDYTFRKEYCEHSYNFLKRAGAIFFGDYTVKYVRNYNDISRLFTSVIDKIGTIQFPHHGSKTGLNKKIIHSYKEYIFCFGIGNIYRHPNLDSVKSVVFSHSYPIFVTDFCSYMQFFKF